MLMYRVTACGGLLINRRNNRTVRVFMYRGGTFVFLAQVLCDQIVNEENALGVHRDEDVILKLGDERTIHYRLPSYVTVEK